MWTARRFLLLLVILSAASCQRNPPPDQQNPPAEATGWELKPLAPGAVPVAAQARLEGIYPVGSQIPDREAIGGFGPCDNYPMNLGGKDWGTKGAISLVAFSNEPVGYGKHRGIALRLVNRTDEVVSFLACNSCLYLIQEALDEGGRWREIEWPPWSDCGNSFHRVFLKPNQFWQFSARLYSGPIKTKIRFRLDTNGDRNGGKALYSNEFEGLVAAVQFRVGDR